MSKLKDFYVSACNKRGFIVYTRIWTAQSAVMACAQAQADMRRTNTEWSTVWTGDPAQPEHMVTTKEG